MAFGQRDEPVDLLTTRRHLRRTQIAALKLQAPTGFAHGCVVAELCRGIGTTMRCMPFSELRSAYWWR